MGSCYQLIFTSFASLGWVHHCIAKATLLEEFLVTGIRSVDFFSAVFFTNEYCEH